MREDSSYDAPKPYRIIYARSPALVWYMKFFIDRIRWLSPFGYRELFNFFLLTAKVRLKIFLVRNYFNRHSYKVYA